MRNYRLKDLLRQVLGEADGIASVERLKDDKRNNPLRVHFTTGGYKDLSVRNTAPPSGDNHDNPEVVVHRDGSTRQGPTGPEWKRQAGGSA
ncbi:hypothetical protein GCM10022243_24050 [Saccharothrix violaceirubra]|uniref:Uncharacterized protein n=1 Tax=Saccharothrix violaceirubra TaxID=413306 RepID=A0A7W7WXY4_9PSEU|nr:hypothetical protein [Saccharothrix violaceirubra]MBB4967850.1 hypothetical protein [Saccharothrix violaceirubra]